MKSAPSFLILAAAALVTACAMPGAGDGGEQDAPQAGPGETGGVCGGIAGFQCEAENAYCKAEPGVCRDTADYAGVCVKKPDFCTMEYAPVCGCDGETYSNACAAASNGVSVAYQGECEPEG